MITIISPCMYIIVNKVFTYPTSVNHPTSASTCVFHAVRIWNPKEREDMGDAWHLRIPVVFGQYVR